MKIDLFQVKKSSLNNQSSSIYNVIENIGRTKYSILKIFRTRKRQDCLGLKHELLMKIGIKYK